VQRTPVVQLPPEEPLPPVPDPAKPGRRLISRDAKARRHATIQKMLAEDCSNREICSFARQHYRIGPQSTMKIIGQIWDEWAMIGRTIDLPRERAKHSHRIAYRLRQATSATRTENGQVVADPSKYQWSAVVALERLYSQIVGTAQPVEVNHTGSVGVALAGVIANLTDEQANEMAAEELERMRKAREYDAMVVTPLPALPARAGAA
jgi:hypothetical protein